ncbi:hypothetical protein A0H81_13143 [Grifola frondosa]|uniref:Uncharacterized protein n=1 Tax=Grifola frondosa TaxID=5627 RepID=A0A1C7LSG5_GRIFR|nr:hypothetical protein A0H81_13143 [Grifola frondosa]
MVPRYSYTAHRHYPQVGNRGRGQNFGIVGLERPKESPVTYTFVYGRNLAEVTIVPRTRRTKKARVAGTIGDSVVEMQGQRSRPPTIPHPRALKIAKSARIARRQKHAAGDHPPSTEVNSVASRLPQQLDDIPSSFVSQTSAVSLQRESYLRPPTTESGVEANDRLLEGLSMRHPYMHPRSIQPAHAPIASQLQAPVTPPFGQSVPGTVLVDHDTISQVFNCVPSSMVYHSSVGPPLVPSGRQDASVASDGVPDHLHPNCNITSPLTQRGHQSQNYPGVYHQQMTFNVPTPPAQMEQHSIYCSPDTPGAQVYQASRGFEEINGVYFNNADQAFMDAYSSPIGPSPTELMALQNDERQPATDATQCFSSQTPHYDQPGAPCGLPLASPPSFRPNTTSRQLRADYMDTMTAGSNVYSGDIKNNIAHSQNGITQQAPYDISHFDNAMPYVISHTSSCDWALPVHPCGSDHCRIPIDTQPYVNHGAPTAQLASVTRNVTYPYAAPGISQSIHLADPAVDNCSTTYAMQLAFGPSTQFPYSTPYAESHVDVPIPQMPLQQSYESSRANSFYDCDTNVYSNTWPGHGLHSALSQSIPNLLGRGASSKHEYLCDGFESTLYQVPVGARDDSPHPLSTGTCSVRDHIYSAANHSHHLMNESYPYNVFTDYIL